MSFHQVSHQLPLEVLHALDEEATTLRGPDAELYDFAAGVFFYAPNFSAETGLPVNSYAFAVVPPGKKLSPSDLIEIPADATPDSVRKQVRDAFAAVREKVKENHS